MTQPTRAEMLDWLDVQELPFKQDKNKYSLRLIDAIRSILTAEPTEAAKAQGMRSAVGYWSEWINIPPDDRDYVEFRLLVEQIQQDALQFRQQPDRPRSLSQDEVDMMDRGLLSSVTHEYDLEPVQQPDKDPASNAQSELLAALKRIAAPRECGCMPRCQCNTPEVLLIELEELKEIATAALKATPTIQAQSSDAQVREAEDYNLPVRAALRQITDIFAQLLLDGKFPSAGRSKMEKEFCEQWYAEAHLAVKSGYAALTGMGLISWETRFGAATFVPDVNTMNSLMNEVLSAIPPADKQGLTENDLTYLRSILRNLDELRQLSEMLIELKGYGLASVIHADSRDWLDCFIDKHERAARPKPHSNEGGA